MVLGGGGRSWRGGSSREKFRRRKIIPTIISLGGRLYNTRRQPCTSSLFPDNHDALLLVIECYCFSAASIYSVSLLNRLRFLPGRDLNVIDEGDFVHTSWNAPKLYRNTFLEHSRKLFPVRRRSGCRRGRRTRNQSRHFLP